MRTCCIMWLDGWRVWIGIKLVRLAAWVLPDVYCERPWMPPPQPPRVPPANAL